MMRRPFGTGLDLALTALFLLLVWLVVRTLDDSRPVPMSGPVRVIDGDTLQVSSQRLRLAGIDAPERHQTCGGADNAWPCGTEATAFLARLVLQDVLSCSSKGHDRYARVLATCFVRGRAVNAAMVEAGYAVASGDYYAEEARARQGRRGLWGGPFEAPRDWRRRQGLLDDAPEDPTWSLRRQLERLAERVRAMLFGTGA